jgi:hypothetical protein
VEEKLMLPTQLNLACASLQNIDKVSLHTADPGNVGDYDSGETKQTLTWTTPSAGYMRATATFSDVTGTFTHIGLWDNTVFIQGRPLNVVLPTEQDLVVLVEFTVDIKT